MYLPTLYFVYTSAILTVVDTLCLASSIRVYILSNSLSMFVSVISVVFMIVSISYIMYVQISFIAFSVMSILVPRKFLYREDTRALDLIL